jgi:hypothetical protein
VAGGTWYPALAGPAAGAEQPVTTAASSPAAARAETSGRIAPILGAEAPVRYLTGGSFSSQRWSLPYSGRWQIVDDL